MLISSRYRKAFGSWCYYPFSHIHNLTMSLRLSEKVRQYSKFVSEIAGHSILYYIS